VSTSTLERALRRLGLLLPRGYRADRKTWAVLRRRVFHDPPTRRNRVWQTDFSEFETPTGGIWRICAVIDYATKYCLAPPSRPPAAGRTRCSACTSPSLGPNGCLTFDDLRANRGTLDLIDETTGELLRTVPAPIAVVSDNGSCFRGDTYQTAFAGDDPLLRHVRTRVRSAQTNGVVERFFGTPKYEHLYRGRIDDGDALAVDPTKPSATAHRRLPISTAPTGQATLINPSLRVCSRGRCRDHRRPPNDEDMGLQASRSSRRRRAHRCAQMAQGPDPRDP
jgi:putative transposase